MRHLFAFLIVFNSTLCFSQIRIFSGYIDKNPIQFVMYSYSDGKTEAIYAYDKYDTPIIIKGNQENDSLILLENNEDGELAAIFKFQNFNPTKEEVTGKWISYDKKTILDIKLSKQHELKSYDKTGFDTIELLQLASTRDNYFKLLISQKGGYDIDVIGVRIYEKKTDRLIQDLELECQLFGPNNISINDYNFDGKDDFSVFESSYSGPNISKVYILKSSDSEKYFVSEITGVSLEFDYSSKLIYEHNQCCAGRSHMTATYKLVDNKMVMIEQKCLEFDDETEDFIEKECY